MNPPTEDQMERDALAEHTALVGRVIRVREISGYVDEDSQDFVLDPPVRLRVLPTRRADILHWNDEHLDPYWDVEILEPRPATLREVRSAWFFGTTRHQGRAEKLRYDLEPGCCGRLWRWLTT